MAYVRGEIESDFDPELVASVLREVGLSDSEIRRVVPLLGEVKGVDLQGVHDSLMYLVLMKKNCGAAALRSLGFSPLISDIYRVAGENDWLDWTKLSTWGYVTLDDDVTGSIFESDCYAVLITKAQAALHGMSCAGADDWEVIRSANLRAGARAYHKVSAEIVPSYYAHGDPLKRLRVVGCKVSPATVVRLDKKEKLSAGVEVIRKPDDVGYCYLSLIKETETRRVALDLGARPAVVDILSLPVEYFRPDWASRKVSGGPRVYHIDDMGDVGVEQAFIHVASEGLKSWKTGTLGAALASKEGGRGDSSYPITCTDLLAGKDETSDEVDAELRNKVATYLSCMGQRLKMESAPFDVCCVQTGGVKVGFVVKNGRTVGIIPLLSMTEEYLVRQCKAVAVSGDTIIGGDCDYILCYGNDTMVLSCDELAVHAKGVVPSVGLGGLSGNTMSDALENLRHATAVSLGQWVSELQALSAGDEVVDALVY